MIEIPLADGLTALVDDEDAAIAASRRWEARPRGQTFYAVARADDEHASAVRLHRVLLGLGPDDPAVDHANGNGLDCRRENLRLATATQNARNRRVLSTSSTGLKGVSPNGAQWRARITVDGRRISLGNYATAAEASEAYAQAAVSSFGVYARPYG